MITYISETFVSFVSFVARKAFVDCRPVREKFAQRPQISGIAMQGSQRVFS